VTADRAALLLCVELRARRPEMTKHLLATIAAVAIMTGLDAKSADAAEFNPIDHAPKAIALDGKIALGDAEKLISVLLYRASHGHETEYLRLNSPGGNVLAGAQIAEIVHKMGIKVVVGANEECSSVCMLAFAAGASRVFTSTSSLGVHSAISPTASSAEMGSNGENLDSLAVTALLAREMTYYGTPSSIVVKLLITPGTDISWLRNDELTQGGWSIWYDDVTPRF
jgi:hypothetical protein